MKCNQTHYTIIVGILQKYIILLQLRLQAHKISYSLYGLQLVPAILNAQLLQNAGHGTRVNLDKTFYTVTIILLSYNQSIHNSPVHILCLTVIVVFQNFCI